MNVNARMRTECAHFLNECEYFLKANLDQSEIDLSWIERRYTTLSLRYVILGYLIVYKRHNSGRPFASKCGKNLSALLSVNYIQQGDTENSWRANEPKNCIQYHGAQFSYFGKV